MGCTFSWFTFSASFSPFSSPATLWSGSFSPNVKFNCWTSKDKLFNWIMVCLNETKRIQRFLKHFGDFGENCWTDWPRLFCFPISDHHLKKQDTLVTSPNMCFFFSSPSFVCFCKRHLQGVFIAPKPGADLGGGCRGRAPPPPPPNDLWLSAKYADMFDKYSQQFTLCYYIDKSLLLCIRF